MNVVSAVILVVFATVGAAALIRRLTNFIFLHKSGAVTLVVPVKGRCENAEFLLREAAYRLRQTGENRDDRVICLDCGMDGETKRICEKFCADCSLASLMGREEFLKLTEQ